MDEPLGEVTIAPNVLTTIVRQTTLEQRGVTRLAPLPPKMRGRVGSVRAADDGVFVAVTEQGVQSRGASRRRKRRQSTEIG